VYVYVHAHTHTHTRIHIHTHMHTLTMWEYAQWETFFFLLTVCSLCIVSMRRGCAPRVFSLHSGYSTLCAWGRVKSARWVHHSLCTVGTVLSVPGGGYSLRGGYITLCAQRVHYFLCTVGTVLSLHTHPTLRTVHLVSLCTPCTVGRLSTVRRDCTRNQGGKGA